jgi:RNA polymerase sigma factor (sigma-70 family)
VNRDSERIYDEYLVTCAITGDRPALARLVERWQPRLLRHAWRVLGDIETARDAVQEGWVEILRGLGRLDDAAAFPAWAFRIVTRRCQRRFRAGLLDYTDEMPDSAAATGSGQPSGEIVAEMGNVLAAMARLPNAQRAALALFHAEDLRGGNRRRARRATGNGQDPADACAAKAPRATWRRRWTGWMTASPAL